MKQIVVNVRDDKTLETVLDFLQGLPNVETQTDGNLKKWTGKLSGIDNPVHVENFRMFSREELYDRKGIY